ncbi:MAG: hypothetical protein HY329_13110 [Chloroflexi bacterium]|nr:hypothetical protein [Chloroflexota bacterium]
MDAATELVSGLVLVVGTGLLLLVLLSWWPDGLSPEAGWPTAESPPRVTDLLTDLSDGSSDSYSDNEPRSPTSNNVKG